MARCCSRDSAVEVRGAAALGVARVVLKTGCEAAAIWLLLDPGLLGSTEVVAAAPAVAALLTLLLLAESI